MHSGVEIEQTLVPADMQFREFKETGKLSKRRSSLFGRLVKEKGDMGDRKSRLLSSSTSSVITSTATANDAIVGNSSTSDNNNNNNNNEKKKRGFLGTWGRRMSLPVAKAEKEDKARSSPFSNIFMRNNNPTGDERSSLNQPIVNLETVDEVEEDNMAQLIENLQLSGKSEAEIAFIVAHMRSEQLRAEEELRRSRGNVVSQWFKDWVDSFREEIQQRRNSNTDGAGAFSVQVSVNPFTSALSDEQYSEAYEMNMSYEDLLALEPVYTGVKSFAHLPACVFNGDPLPSQQTACPICISDYCVGEELRSLQCFHFFHKECVDRWLAVSRSCPVCKNCVQ